MYGRMREGSGFDLLSFKCSDRFGHDVDCGTPEMSLYYSKRF